jgi:hypothetical protein
MGAIPFPTSSRPGQHAQESRGRLVNVYAEELGDDKVILRPVPGLASFCDTAKSTPRGFLDVSGLLYAAYENVAVTITAAGVVTTLTGALSGSLPVTWARNNKSPTPDVVCVTENGAFTVTSAAVSSFADPDLPSVNSVSNMDGYFLFTTGSGQIWASGLNAVTVDALAFATAEANPDGLTRGIVSGGLFYACGSTSIEVWQNAATSPFPLSRAAVIPVGLASAWAIAGFEPGWDTAPIFVAADNTVRQMQGYQPQIISNKDVERAIAGVADKDDLEASVYTFGGHAIWSLSGPDFTWDYNTSTGQWHERASYQSDRWRASRSVYFDGRWLVGDTASTKLLEISESTRLEDTDPLVSIIESDAIKGFPARVAVRRADFDFVVGQGNERGADPIETDPQVAVSWSDDGGVTWANPLLRDLGRQGESRTAVRVNRTGLTTQHGRRWRLTVSDPVAWALMGGDMQGQGRAV